jgi:hypothetical protein
MRFFILLVAAMSILSLTNLLHRFNFNKSEQSTKNVAYKLMISYHRHLEQLLNFIFSE